MRVSSTWLVDSDLQTVGLQSKAGRGVSGRHGGLFFSSWCQDFQSPETEEVRGEAGYIQSFDNLFLCCLWTILQQQAAAVRRWFAGGRMRGRCEREGGRTARE